MADREVTPEQARIGWSMSCAWIAWALSDEPARTRYRRQAEQSMVALYIHVGRGVAARLFQRTQGRLLSLGELQSAADLAMCQAARTFDPRRVGKDSGKPVSFAPLARRWATEQCFDALKEASDQPLQLLPMADDMEHEESEEPCNLDLRRWLRTWAYQQLALPAVTMAPSRPAERRPRMIRRHRSQCPYQQLALLEWRPRQEACQHAA